MTKKNTDELTDTDTEEANLSLSQDASKANLPFDVLMTRREVAQLLRVTEHCLSSNREKWKCVLPRIEMEGSNIIRYRRSDVMRLLEGGTPSSFNEGE